MGFADYFLIVWDFIRFAKTNGIGVGPGRGTAAGSLVAYCLEITDIDPIQYDLLFERFLNPGRKSMPDIDIDFSVHGRDQVINYVSEKYGRDRVAQIITFGTMMARAAVRDAGRVLDIPYGTVDRIAKLIPEGPKVYLDECLKPDAELKQAYDADEIVRQIVDLARPLEGLVRQDSIHAAGVVIGDRPLTDYLPLQQKGADQELVTQFAMGDVEALGLLKMDFLGLRNLDVLDKAVDLVGGLDLTKIPLDDPKTYEMLARGDSTGVFQFESSGMREALRQVRPTEFEDLIALVALYRPGPMAYIPVYGKRKAGQEPVSFLDHAWSRSSGRPSGSSSTRSWRWRSPSSSPASRPPRPTTCARRSARRSTRSWPPSRRSSSRGARRTASPPGWRTNSGRTWSRRRTTPSTSRTPPATRSSPTARRT